MKMTRALGRLGYAVALVIATFLLGCSSDSTISPPQPLGFCL
jgi:hypothetical protein